MDKILINGREYSWGDITLLLGGKVVAGSTNIKYKASQSKEALYGKGNEPIAIQRGNRSYEGSIELLQSEVASLMELGRMKKGFADLLCLNLNAVVCYGNPEEADPMITDKLFGIEFTECEKGMGQGDPNMKVTLPFICTRIVYNTL